MRICTRCLLPESFPSIRFNDEGVCNHCLEFKNRDPRRTEKEQYRKRFESIVHETRSRSGYHCLSAYSGGKDSTYTLWLLREHYGLNVLAVTLDSGFVSPKAFANIRRIVEVLCVDHLFVKPRLDLLVKIFRSVSLANPFPSVALQRASSICNACIGLVKNVTLRMAIEQKIPLW